MSQKTIAVAAVVAAALLAGIFSTSASAYDARDESETNTEQKLKQKNVGSSESTNFNCGENNIDTLLPIQACGTVDLGEEAVDDAGTAPSTFVAPSTP
jgi:curli biogenesis system outer membrane secretion channel CsgG